VSCSGNVAYIRYQLYGISCTVSVVRYQLYSISCTVSAVLHQLYGISCTVSVVQHQLYGISCTVSVVRYQLNSCGRPSGAVVAVCQLIRQNLRRLQPKSRGRQVRRPAPGGLVISLNVSAETLAVATRSVVDIT
jgi:hypothetical protein